MATSGHKLVITTTWSGNTGPKPDHLDYTGAYLYCIGTGTTASAAQTNLNNSSGRCFCSPGSSAQTLYLTCTATTVYASIIAMRPGCTWSAATGKRLYTTTDNTFSLTCTSTPTANPYLKGDYLAYLSTISGYSAQLSEALQDFSKSQYTTYAGVPLVMTKKLVTVTGVGRNYTPVPFSSTRYVSLKSLYFATTSAFKSDGVKIKGELINVDIEYSIYIPSVYTVGQAEVFVADGPNEGSSTSLASHNYSDWGDGIEGSSTFSINTSADTLYVGVVLDQNPNYRTINVSVTGGATTTTTGTYAEAAVDFWAMQVISFSITMY